MRWPWTWKATRDTLLFFGGMAGAAHEIVISENAEPYVLMMCAAAMGLPAFLRTDEAKGPDMQIPSAPPQPTEPDPTERAAALLKELEKVLTDRRSKIIGIAKAYPASLGWLVGVAGVAMMVSR